jgi:FkbM family methyltransferase
MSVRSVLGYRALYWASATLAALAFAGWNLAARSIGDPRFYDPHEVSALRDADYPFTVEVNGYIYRGRTGDFIDDQILAFGAYEKDALYFMRDYVRALADPGAVFLDVGACEGQHSLFMSRLVAQVHSFEPFPPAAERFRGLVRLNGFTNIQLHEVGLGSKDASIPFFAPPAKNLGSGTFLPSHSQGRSRPVGSFRVVNGDAWLAPSRLTSVDVVKIDVEGFEGEVLRGLSRTLAKFRPVLVIEVSLPQVGTLVSLDDLKRLLPERYAFLGFEDNRERAITGNYKLVRLDRFARGRDYEMVVAYPLERRGLIRMERAPGGS